ncbi:MAG: hypothetical protein ABI624_18500, partial [Casimicrobiaceae bacterium]
MTEDEIDCFNDSLARCTGSGRFIDRFYERFIASSDEVQEKFKNTDMRRQRRMIGASLYMVMLAVDGHPEGTLHLERMATVHGPGAHDVPARLYDLWLTCLLQTVRECDPRFTP